MNNPFQQDCHWGNKISINQKEEILLKCREKLNTNKNYDQFCNQLK